MGFLIHETHRMVTTQSGKHNVLKLHSTQPSITVVPSSILRYNHFAIFYGFSVLTFAYPYLENHINHL